ncbi:Ribosomal large subunit pseudouridine synthase (Partial), partial [Seminavis robusta]
VVVYSPKNAGQGLLTVKAALPHALQPPRQGTLSALKRPKSVHRLDKPTSGILVVGKTLPAMDHLSRQFRDRLLQKTYTAIVNGVPQHNNDHATPDEQQSSITTDKNPWQWIDYPLEGKQAVTAWRIVRQVPSIRARDNVLTMVEVMPKTGRYHQIRRHMAWVCERPLVGDKEYDGNHPDAVKLRGRGLFLCSNQITIEHPFYNTRAGRQVWESLADTDKPSELWVRPEDDMVMLTASITLPQKFHSLMDRSEAVYNKYAASMGLPVALEEEKL